MKKSDILFALVVVILFSPFFVFEQVYAWYISFNDSHGMVMSFLKFALLATMGEMLGLRISTGSYYFKGFGVLPRAIVWGFFGMVINMAIIIFSTGVPAFAAYLGMDNAREVFAGPMSWGKLGLAFAVSVTMNILFGTVFMTFHKITDTHILQYGGSLRALVTPIQIGKIIKNLNWDVQWNFVFKKTIPLFWFPAHTITFLLPGETRVLFAALLGVFLGVLLAIAARKR